MPNEEIELISFEQLSLDPNNPRLPESLDKRDEKAIIDYIANSTAIENLMSAIAENGYFVGEPLIVSEDNELGLVVVEGNRRLTAVKLLNNPNACTKPTAKMFEIIESSKLAGRPIPKELPIVIKSREESLAYLGFRHITGVQQWEPLAKARYLKLLYDSKTNSSLEPRDRYRIVAQAIGSRLDYIQRSLDALAVYKIIEESDFFGIEGLDDRSVRFAVLSTALANEKIGSFVGITKKNPDGSTSYVNPINDNSSLNSGEIRLLTEWLFKKDGEGNTKVGESRNLPKLGAIVANKNALQAFIDGARLESAYILTSENIKEFIDLLYQTEASVTQAAGMVATVKFDQGALSLSKNIGKTISLIHRALQEKQTQDDGGFGEF